MTVDIHTHAHAYVVGALTDEETAEFERHLIECDECVAEVLDARAVASALSTVVATDPPAGLRSRVLAEIATTPQDESPSATTEDRPLVAVGSPTPAPQAGQPGAPEGSNVVPIRPSWRSRGTSLLAAAAVIAAVGFGGWAIQSSQDARASREAAEVAASQSAALQNLLSADDVRTVSGRFAKTDHTGTVVMSQERGQAMLVTSGLPDLPDDKVYEAWTIDGDPEPAGTFTSDGDAAMVELPDATFGADSVAVTVEPDGGSPEPTSDAIFTVSMPQS